MVLVKMNVFFHLKVDCPEILSAGFFKPKKFNFAAKFFTLGFDQSYPHIITNVEISRLNRNYQFYKNSGRKIEFSRYEICRQNFNPPR